MREHIEIGGGMDEMRRLQGEVENLREIEGFYHGRYHAGVLMDQVEHYRWLTWLHKARTHIGMQGGGESGWITGSS